MRGAESRHAGIQAARLDTVLGQPLTCLCRERLVGFDPESLRERIADEEHRRRIARGARRIGGTEPVGVEGVVDAVGIQCLPGAPDELLVRDPGRREVKIERRQSEVQSELRHQESRRNPEKDEPDLARSRPRPRADLVAEADIGRRGGARPATHRGHGAHSKQHRNQHGRNLRHGARES